MNVLTHEKALDLAADRIDFGLTEDEAAGLDHHLDDCFDCKRYATMMAEDDSLLETSITWEDAGPSGAPDVWDEAEGEPAPVDDPEWSSERGSDDEDDESGFGADSEEGDLSVGSSESDDHEEGDDHEDLEDLGPLDDSPSSDRRDFGGEDQEDDELDVTPVAADVAEMQGGAEPDDSDEGEADPNVNDGTTGLKPGKPVDEDTVHTNHETEEQEEAYRIKQEVDALTDEELAGVDEDGENQMPDCVADGVEDAAEENGAPVGDAERQRAETVVRDEEGIAHTDYGNVAVYKSFKGIKGSSNGTPQASAAAAAQIRNAVLKSRTGRTGVERFHKRGRLDGKALHRIAMKDERLFKKNTATDPGKFFVRVAVDVSGSMSGQPVLDAAAVARALAEATSGIPTVRLEIWAWSDPFTNDRRGWYGGRSCAAGVLKVWGRGQPASDVFRLASLPMGGTPDAPVLDWMWRDMAKHVRSDERAVIFIASDGWGDRRLPLVIENAARHDVSVKGVALGGYVHEDDMLARFGRGNYVSWPGSMEAIARPLADMVLRMATGEDR